MPTTSSETVRVPGQLQLTFGAGYETASSTASLSPPPSCALEIAELHLLPSSMLTEASEAPVFSHSSGTLSEAANVTNGPPPFSALETAVTPVLLPSWSPVPTAPSGTKISSLSFIAPSETATSVARPSPRRLSPEKLVLTALSSSMPTTSSETARVPGQLQLTFGAGSETASSTATLSPPPSSAQETAVSPSALSAMLPAMLHVCSLGFPDTSCFSNEAWRIFCPLVKACLGKSPCH